MKVGIDGVLLGVWAPVENVSRVLDIGTGTGLIALMIAQRSPALIDAIDIDADAVGQATENSMNSPWESRIHTQHISLQDLAETTEERYDLIVSNPPYFNNSTKAPAENRTTARHTDSLTHEELIGNAMRLLKPTGRICIILPVNEGLRCVDFALTKGLSCSRLVKVYPKPNADVKRLLLEFSLTQKQRDDSELVIESDIRHQYSTEFTGLAKDYYLKL